MKRIEFGDLLMITDVPKINAIKLTVKFFSAN